MSRRAAKIDANQRAIVTALEQCGAKVLSLARLGDGVPDLLVTVGTRFTFCEVKAGKGTLTPGQQDFIAAGWPVAIVRTIEEAAALAVALRR